MALLSTAQFTQTSMQDQAQLILSPVYMSASKLDADQYMAQDIDGVTESLFGSGNLNFLMLQAGQTNDLLAGVTPFTLGNETGASAVSLLSSTDFGSGAAIFSNSYAYETGGSLATGSPSLNLGLEGVAIEPASVSAPVTGGITLASGAASGFQSGFASGFSSSGGPAVNTQGQDGQAGNDGDDGNAGHNGTDGGGGGGDTTIINIDLGDVYLGDLIDIEQITNFLTETLNNLTEVINNIDITDLGETLLTEIFNTTNNLIDNITTIIGDVTDITEILNVTEIVNNLVNNIFDLTDALDGGLTLNLDAVLSEILSLDAELLQGGSVTQLIDQVIDLTPLTDPLDQLIDLDGINLADIGSSIGLLGGEPDARDPAQDIDLGVDLNGALGDLELVDAITDIVIDPVEDIVGDVDILTGVGLDLLNTSDIDNAQGDSDITLASDLDLLNSDLVGLDLDIPLDPIEALIGDVDLDLGLATDLLGGAADPLVDGLVGGSAGDTLVSDIGDAVQDLAGDVVDEVLPGFTDGEIISGDIDLFNSENTDNAQGDNDLTLGLDIDLIDTEIIDLPLPEINLDVVEAIIGDVDLDVDVALDILTDGLSDGDVVGDILGSVSDTLESIGGEWTENILPGGGDNTGDGLGGVLDSVLPDPVGSIAEGLGSLIPGGDDLSGGLGGGLLGGGLFG